MTIFGITMSIVQGLLFILLGAVVVMGSLVGGVMLLAKAIADSNAHNQATCECVECQRRRWTAAEKRQQKRVEDKKHNQNLNLKKPTDEKTQLVSTSELQLHEVVYLYSGQWRVTEKLVTMLGIFIRLQSVTQPTKTSRIRIRNSEVEHKIWSLRPRDWTK